MASRIKVSALALSLLGNGLLAVYGDRSAAEPLTAEFTDQPGGWQARANFDPNGKLTTCLALRFSEFRKDADVKLGVAAKPADTGGGVAWAVNLFKFGSRDSWPLGKPMSIDLIFDGQTHIHGVLSAADRSSLFLPLYNDDVVKQFRKSYTMSVSVEGQRFEFSLAGTYQLLPVLTDCVRTYVRTPLAAAPVTAEQAEQDCARPFDDSDRAIAGCDQILARGTKLSAKERAIVHRARGAAYYSKGNYGRALADTNEAIRLVPDDPPAYGNRATLHARRGDYELAIKDAEQAIRLDPKVARPHAVLAYVLAEMGNFDRAQKEIDDAFRLGNKDAFAFLYRGEIYLLKKEPQLALNDFDAALVLSPHLPFAKAGRDAAQSALNPQPAASASPATSAPQR